jgi:membrane associated rhomboid family serine protease
MGISDREYVRNAPRPRGRLGRNSPLSVTMWIIIINIGVHLLANTVLPVLYNLGHFSTATALFFVHNGQTVFGLEVWRFITFQFLHAPGIMHIFFNMFGLWVFGGLVEDYLGRKRYAAFYLVCGIFGALAYVLLNLLESVFHLPIPGDFSNPASPLVGASAGVFGVIMASAYIAPNAIVQLLIPPIPMKLKWFAYGYVCLAAFAVITGGGNAGGDAAHVGGALAGFFFIRNAHLLRDFFDIFADSRNPGHAGAPERRRKSAPGRDEVDRILAKVGTEGLHSLSDAERRTLREATESERRH